MQTSRFQIGLIATLAVGLGFSLASSDAVGYPAGAAVSTGTNPVFSQGGSVTGLEGVTTEVLTAPDDQKMLVTDLGLGLGAINRSCDAEISVRLTNSSGDNLAEYLLIRPEYGTASPSHSGAVTTIGLSSGIPVDAGETLQMTTTFLTQDCPDTFYSFRYTLSGYYAHP